MNQRPRNNFYHIPVVPYEFRRMTLDTMPSDQTFWVEPGDNDDWAKDCQIFVDQSGSLCAYRDMTIESQMIKPTSLRGLVGVVAVDMTRHDLFDQRQYVADLRFIDNSSLEVVDFSEAPDDQEEANGYYDQLKSLLKFSGFVTRQEKSPIVSRRDTDQTEIVKQPYDCYGPVALKSVMQNMVARSSRLANRLSLESNEIARQLESITTTGSGSDNEGGGPTGRARVIS